MARFVRIKFIAKMGWWGSFSVCGGLYDKSSPVLFWLWTAWATPP